MSVCGSQNCAAVDGACAWPSAGRDGDRLACWIAAYLFGYLQRRSTGSPGLLAVTAVLVVTISWAVSWVIVEAAVLDWRPPARQAAAYDLLSRARLEVTMEAGTPS